MHAHAHAGRTTHAHRHVPLQVVCPPDEGVEFLTPEFVGVFGGWFPEGSQHDPGVWLGAHTLLKSSLIDGDTPL
jgi:hypothetical protein